MTTACLKSPITRLGGKSNLANWLLSFIPPHKVYAETFTGAGHLLFTKLQSHVEILNDVDNHLIDFFRIIKDLEKRQRLIEALKYMLYSRTLWQEIRSRWKTGDIPRDGIERAAEWFFLNRTCFGGDQQSGGFATPSTTGRNPVMSFRNAIKTFEDVAKRLRTVCVENLDYADCIRRYDSPDTLFFCDPPYLDAEHYYGKDFNRESHHVLAKLLHAAKGRIMLTHYQNGLYDSLYDGWHRYEYQSFKGSSKSDGEAKPVTTEVLYTNFRPLKNRSLFNG